MAESPKVSKNTSLIKTKSKSTSGTKLRKTNANYSFTLNSNGNNIENLREEINYLRQTIVSCNKEYSKIKTEQVKIEEEIKRNTLCLDEILRTSPTLTRLMINSIILGEDVSNESVLELSEKNINLLIERYIISVQKSKNKELLVKIDSKEDEIRKLQKMTKTNNMTKLANDIMINHAELTELNNQLENLKIDYNELDSQYQQLKNEKKEINKKVRDSTKETERLEKENLELAKKNIEYEKQEKKRKRGRETPKIGTDFPRLVETGK